MTVFFHSELSASILAESSHFFRRTPGFLAGDTAPCKQDRDVLAALHGQRLAGAHWGGRMDKAGILAAATAWTAFTATGMSLREGNLFN
jgi:hypothetical protein